MRGSSVIRATFFSPVTFLLVLTAVPLLVYGQPHAGSPEGQSLVVRPTSTPVPTATPLSTATPSPTPTPTFTPPVILTPSPTPTPTPVPCSFFTLTGWSDASRVGTYSSRETSLWGHNVFQQRGNSRPGSSMPACLSSILSAHSVNLSSVTRGDWYDYHLGVFLNRIGSVFMNSLTEAQRAQYNRVVWQDSVAMTQLVQSSWNLATRFLNRFVIDSNCRAVAIPQPEQICGEYVYRWDSTPLGLVLDEDAARRESSVVEFDLDPGVSHGNSHFLWRASDKFPLLVFDPRASRKVTSAYQLFGSWTFGGRHIDSTSGQGTKWQNGYEPLSVLDKDGDAALTGEELTPIALWFDSNQDGVSDEGEVISAREFGVTWLATQPDTTSELHHEISATTGYRLESFSGVRTGRSVDWSSFGAKSKSEVLEHLQRTARLETSAQSTSTVSNSAVEPLKGPETPEAPKLVGLWHWQLESDGKSDRGTEGVLEFRLTKHGLDGVNAAVRPLKDKAGTPHWEFEVLPLSELTTKKKGELLEVTFRTATSDGKIVENSANVDLKNGRLVGTSKLTLPLAGDTRVVSYSWTAVRMPG